MTTFYGRIRFILAAWVVLAAIALAAPALAQQSAPDGAPDPDASVVGQKTLLQQAPRIEGRIDIPDTKASVLEQPAGRTWVYFHEILLHWFGAIVILGMIGALTIAYLIMGKIRISRGRRIKVHRFDAFERFSHWLTAVSFVLLGLTGLNITFGKILLLPLIGPTAFTSWSEAAKFTHNFVSFAFVIGLVLIIALWIKDNIPRKVDVDWVKQGSGFIKSKHAPPDASTPAKSWSSGLRWGPALPSSSPAICCSSPSTGRTSPRCRSARSCMPW